MTGKTDRIGPLTQDMPATWECVVCGISPKRGQTFYLVANDDTMDTTVTVQHELLADCGIPGTTGPHGESVAKPPG